MPLEKPRRGAARSAGGSNGLAPHNSLAAFLLLLPLVFALGSCGYSFPQLKDDDKARVIYMADWENRTQRLSLDNRIYQSLARWFRKSAVFHLTKNRKGADYVLAGEILSIDLPSISWANRARVSQINLTLRVRYVVKDVKSGNIVWEVANKAYSSDFEADMEISDHSETDALNEIVGDLAEDLYIGLLHRIRRQEEKAQREGAQATQEEAQEPAPDEEATDSEESPDEEATDSEESPDETADPDPAVPVRTR